MKDKVFCIAPYFIALLLTFCFLMGCRESASQKPGAVKTDTVIKAATQLKSSPVAALDTMAASSAEYCNCFRQTMGSFDPQTEALILKSIEQPQPLQYLENEIAKMTDPASQQQAVKDLESFSNFDAASPCILSVSKKYGIDETDPAILKRIVANLERYPDCKLVTALFKIAYAEEVPK